MTGESDATVARLIGVMIVQVVRDDILNDGPISAALAERFGDKDEQGKARKWFIGRTVRKKSNGDSIPVEVFEKPIRVDEPDEPEETDEPEE